MSGKIHRNFIFVASLGPPLVMAATVAALWGRFAGTVDIALFALFYAITAIGISVGYHRMLSHRSFKARRPVRFMLALFGTLAAQGPAITWAAHHRRHHKLADREGDPHSPHLHGEEGLRGLLKGFWHSHMGWLFDDRLTSDPMRFTPDLVREPEMRWLSRHFLAVVAAGIATPGVIAWAITGRPIAVATGMVWGGVARIFALHHATYAVNSIGHIAGKRRFETSDESRNVAWLALPSLGEAYHNNHHAFPNSAVIGDKRSELDLGWAVIRLLERVGWVYDVVRPSPDRRLRKATAMPSSDEAPRTRRVAERPVRELVGASRDLTR